MCTNYEGNGIKAHVGRKDLEAIRETLARGSNAMRRTLTARSSGNKRQMVEYGSLQEACAALKGKEKTIIMAHADWCGFCKAMKSDFEALLEKAPSGVMVGRLNANAIKPGEVCEGVEEIKAYPTILYNNGSKITKVMGRQSLQALLDLLKK
jgi:thiol-disulfide isomerase/thioredoxin